MTDGDHVVLLDDDGNPVGTAPKSSVHGTETALHLAFSCHVLNEIEVTGGSVEDSIGGTKSSPWSSRSGRRFPD